MLRWRHPELESNSLYIRNNCSLDFLSFLCHLEAISIDFQHERTLCVTSLKCICDRTVYRCLQSRQQRVHALFPSNTLHQHMGVHLCSILMFHSSIKSFLSLISCIWNCYISHTRTWLYVWCGVCIRMIHAHSDQLVFLLYGFDDFAGDRCNQQRISSLAFWHFPLKKALSLLGVSLVFANCHLLNKTRNSCFNSVSRYVHHVGMH